MLLCLTGMPGCGKSSTGRELAERLGLPFLDLDNIIESRTGRTIPDLFATEGEAFFRTKEQEALTAVLAGHEDGVLALGGGTVMTPACADLVRRQTCCFYLKVRPETLCARLSACGQTENRPLLTAAGRQPDALRKRMETLLADREPAYVAAARHVIISDGLSPAETAEKIGIIFAASVAKRT